MGLYVFVYIGVALISPWFLRTHVLYLALVVPISLKVLYEFFVYLKSSARERWIHFFLWVNLSLIIYVGVPVFDRWVDLFVPIISP
ncbi:MAG: hypothetical protein KDD29_10730, partial [Flavobacteriales bacterium]|nr:hypothetical protein [Flavobacteriales bacterium]